MASSLIPKDGGVNPINGLPIRRHVCVVYDNATLEILAIADTHNKADEIATDRFNRGIDAISSEIRYHNDDISPAMLVGMKMNDFQCFVDNNNHPLNPSTKKVDGLTFVTDLDSVQLAYIESDVQKLTLSLCRVMARARVSRHAELGHPRPTDCEYVGLTTPSSCTHWTERTRPLENALYLRRERRF